jgi:NitT/TauT family transport system permease protein
MLPGIEPPVIFVTFIAAFFATVLNTLLGVLSIDRSYFRAAECLGFSPRNVLVHVVVPGALPFIFTDCRSRWASRGSPSWRAR